MKTGIKNFIMMALLSSVLSAVCGCVAGNAPRLSGAEKGIIDADGIMRVLSISDRKDSLVLRSKCVDFPKRALRSERFHRLADRMVATVTDSTQDGVGIAGPQVGLKRRVVAVQRFDKEGKPFEVYPNIRIVYRSEETQTGPEGCLSVPDIYGNVERSQTVVISYIDINTLKPVRDTVSGFTAVIFQHETDHLDGILFTDRMCRGLLVRVSE
jgi:peptide deformylase